jgi:hypothetical protein
VPSEVDVQGGDELDEPSGDLEKGAVLRDVDVATAARSSPERRVPAQELPTVAVAYAPSSPVIPYRRRWPA